MLQDHHLDVQRSLQRFGICTTDGFLCTFEGEIISKRHANLDIYACGRIPVKIVQISIMQLRRCKDHTEKSWVNYKPGIKQKTNWPYRDNIVHNTQFLQFVRSYTQSLRGLKMVTIRLDSVKELPQ
jgi:hypothetical protein